MTRRPVIAGNWKMHKLQNEAVELVNAIMDGIRGEQKENLPEVVVAPTYTSLHVVNKAINDCGCGKVGLACQNAYYEKEGAFTGEISVEMAQDTGCKYVIIGHSERRQYFKEDDALINKKAKAILNNELIPIICCGETLEQREAGIADTFVSSQIEKALEDLTKAQVEKIIIAYEPIWAIGTGKTCDSTEANRIIRVIRSVVAKIAGNDVAEKVRILYGGSVKPSTIQEQMAQSDIDGALVGGASLKADSFVEIIKGAM